MAQVVDLLEKYYDTKRLNEDGLKQQWQELEAKIKATQAYKTYEVNKSQEGVVGKGTDTRLNNNMKRLIGNPEANRGTWRESAENLDKLLGDIGVTKELGKTQEIQKILLKTGYVAVYKGNNPQNLSTNPLQYLLDNLKSPNTYEIRTLQSGQYKKDIQLSGLQCNKQELKTAILSSIETGKLAYDNRTKGLQSRLNDELGIKTDELNQAKTTFEKQQQQNIKAENTFEKQQQQNIKAKTAFKEQQQQNTQVTRVKNPKQEYYGDIIDKIKLEIEKRIAEKGGDSKKITKENQDKLAAGIAEKLGINLGSKNIWQNNEEKVQKALKDIMPDNKKGFWKGKAHIGNIDKGGAKTRFASWADKVSNKAKNDIGRGGK